jgi:hypothetical protein
VFINVLNFEVFDFDDRVFLKRNSQNFDEKGRGKKSFEERTREVFQIIRFH